ncbi:MAG TPA: RNHCP domain-containing protein [Candidatus Gracilibacteria bacterium]|nr:RNHCP domain-containing protein [Candidatus Gracilibacteria bacterium]
MKSNNPARKNPISLNEGFNCKKCEKNNPKADTGCRNHCRFCLYSMHVDLDTPGDRLNDCLGLMEPTGMLYSGKKGWQIVHKCIKCGVEKLNVVAPDDDGDLVVDLTRRQNMEPLDYEKNHKKQTGR